MIRFVCSCGKQLQTKDSHAGEAVTCPGCGAELVVPDPDGTRVQDRPPPARRRAADDDFDDPGERRPVGRRDRADTEAGSSRTIWLIAGIGAGVTVLAAGIVILVLVLGKDGGGGDGPGGRIAVGDEPRLRQMSVNNLRQIILAMHNYHDACHRFPPAVVYDRNGKPLYSWRVLLLPYIEQDVLYRQFHLNEPWDSPHNKALLERMPPTYAHPGGTSKTDTHCLVFDSPAFVNPRSAFNSQLPAGGLQPGMLRPAIGADQIFEIGTPTSIVNFLDGTSNSILVVEADKAVPWTKPEDLIFGANQPLPALGHLYPSGRFVVGLADGQAFALDRSQLSDATLRAAITINGGEVMGSDWPTVP
jgi:hypothetical protein